MEAIWEKVQHPFSTKLIIPKSRLKNASEDKTSAIRGDKYQALTIPGLIYWIYITPRDNKEDHKNQTQLTLCVVFEGIESIAMECEWNIKSANYKWHSSRTLTESKRWGPHICLYKDLLKPSKKWIVGGNLTVECTGVFSAQILSQVNIKSKNSMLLRLWDRGDKDYTFVVGDKEIKVHKLLLATASTVFNQMLQTEWKETTEGKYTIEDFDYDVVYAAVQFFYDKAITTTIPNAISLMQFADKYDIADLKNKMEDYLIGESNNVNVVQFSNASILANASRLRKKCFDFLLANLRKTHIADIDELDADFKDEFMKEVFNCVSVIGP